MMTLQEAKDLLAKASSGVALSEEEKAKLKQALHIVANNLGR